MNREELLKIAKPILFNTEMVQAILEGNKSVTRRLIKLDLGLADTDKNDNSYLMIPDEYGDYHDAKDLCNYQVGDILYVRETIWQKVATTLQICGEMEMFWHNEFKYVATDEEPEAEWNHTWSKRPSIHMPKDAARIFLKVTDVRVERLQDITVEDVEKEGYPNEIDFDTMPIAMQGIMFEWWTNTWDSTIKKQDMYKYSLKANPWVWVVEFEVLKI